MNKRLNERMREKEREKERKWKEWVELMKMESGTHLAQVAFSATTIMPFQSGSNWIATARI